MPIRLDLPDEANLSNVQDMSIDMVFQCLQFCLVNIPPSALKTRREPVPTGWEACLCLWQDCTCYHEHDWGIAGATQQQCLLQ